MGKCIDPMLVGNAGSGVRHRPRRSSASMSLQPVIPWRVALQQRPPPLHRPGPECATVVLLVDSFSATGEQGLNRLCQPRGQPHSFTSTTTTQSGYKRATTRWSQCPGTPHPASATRTVGEGITPAYTWDPGKCGQTLRFWRLLVEPIADILDRKST